MLPVLGGARRTSAGRRGPWPGRPRPCRTSARRLPGRSRRRSRHPSWFRPSRCLQAPLGFLLQTLGQLVQDVARLVNPAALLAGAWVDLAERLPEAERAVAERQLRTHFKAAPLEIEQNFEPGLLTLAIAVGDGDQFLQVPCPWPRRSPDRLLFLHAGAEIDAVHPEIDVALGREVAPLPALRLNPPDLFQPGDRGRKPRRSSPGAPPRLPRSRRWKCPSDTAMAKGLPGSWRGADSAAGSPT